MPVEAVASTNPVEGAVGRGAAYPIPTLNGNAAGTVLTVGVGSVVQLKDLTITNGLADVGARTGGGILACRDTLTGAVAGGNVHNNYRGSVGTTEDNISTTC
jgi:hypothetical protein